MSGLPGVHVAVEDVSADEKALGLSREVLRQQVESALNAGGVPLLDSVQRQRTPGAPYLYVHVGAVTWDGHVIPDLTDDVMALVAKQDG